MVSGGNHMRPNEANSPCQKSATGVKHHAIVSLGLGVTFEDKRIIRARRSNPFPASWDRHGMVHRLGCRHQCMYHNFFFFAIALHHASLSHIPWRRPLTCIIRCFCVFFSLVRGPVFSVTLPCFASYVLIPLLSSGYCSNN